MANHSRAVLEQALRARRLDQTLTTARPPSGGSPVVAATGVPSIDRILHGGFPQGQLSEIAGPPSSGRLTVALQLMAGATRRGELAACVDTLDRLDVASTVAAGVVLERLLWVRGHAAAVPAGHARALDRALKACMLILQAGGFGLVMLDLADVPMSVLRQLPPPTWLRVQRAVEGRDTACVLLTPEPLARSAGGLTLSLTARPAWQGPDGCSRVMAGLVLEGRVRSPRQRSEEHLSVSARHAWMPDAPAV